MRNHVSAGVPEPADTDNEYSLVTRCWVVSKNGAAMAFLIDFPIRPDK